MSAVVSAVEGAFQAVGDAVGAVVDGATHIVDEVVTHVVEPVAKAVDNTIQAAINDPIGTLAKVATAVVAPEFLPLVNIADNVAHGQDLGKALVNAGVNYVAGDIGNGIGDQISNQLCLSCTVGNAVNTGLKGATAAVIKGQNPLCGAVGSLVNSGLNAGATSVYRCFTSGSGCNSSKNCLPATVSGGTNDCVKGCASTTNLGGLPSGTDNLDTVTVTGSKTGCTDLTCTQSGLTRGLDGTTLPTVTVVGKKDTCTDLTCTNNDTNTTTTGALPTVTVTGKKDTCTDLTCTTDCTSLPPVTVVGKKPTCCCSCDCCDTKVTLPKIVGPKVVKPKTVTASKGTSGCSNIPWLDTSDAVLKNIIPLSKISETKDGEKALKDMYGKTISCSANEPQGGVPQVNLDPFTAMKGGLVGSSFASGGSPKCECCQKSNTACGQAYCFNQDAKYMPKFINCGPDTLQSVGSSKRQNQALSPKQLSQLAGHISNMGNMGGLASGGLPKKYHDAMPEGHNPEFVTGLTGYYACGGGTGQSDDIPAMLHDGDYVMDADVVAALGDGSSKAGREILDGFREKVPHHDTAKGQPVPAKIADGEYVFPAGFVNALGGGDNKAGAKVLDGLREKLRAHKRSAPTSKIPPKAKSPLDYIKAAKG